MRAIEDVSGQSVVKAFLAALPPYQIIVAPLMFDVAFPAFAIPWTAMKAITAGNASLQWLVAVETSFGHLAPIRVVTIPAVLQPLQKRMGAVQIAGRQLRL